MRKFIISTFISILISACGSSDTTTTNITEKDCSLIVTGTTQTTGDCTKTITANNSTISIQAGPDIDELILEGSNNLLTFISGSIAIITVNGNDNTLISSLALTIDNDNGSGNSVIIQ